MDEGERLGTPLPQEEAADTVDKATEEDAVDTANKATEEDAMDIVNTTTEEDAMDTANKTAEEGSGRHRQQDCRRKKRQKPRLTSR